MFGLLAASSALAQTPAPDAPIGKAAAATETTGISEIIVTATRTAQNLQSVPIAVTAFNAQALEARQITDTQRLVQSIPNTTFTATNFGGSNLAIRGVGTTAVSTSGDSGVGIHINDMPLVAPGLVTTEIFDMQRVEVLRGPQGTLFGRNATAGVVNFITNKASTKGLQAFGEFEYGNYNSIKLTGMFNFPINDKLAIRAAGIYIKRDGYTTNLWNNEDIDGRDNYSLRGSVHWEPTEKLTVDVMVGYGSEDSSRTRAQKQLCVNDPTGVLGCSPNGLAYQPVNANATAGSILASQEALASVFGGLAPLVALGSLYGPNIKTNAIVPTSDREVYTLYTPTYQGNGLTVMGNVDYAFEKATLSLIGGYSQNSFDSRMDYSLSVNDVQTTIAKNKFWLDTVFPGKSQAIFNNQGQMCLSQYDQTMVGYIGGKYNSCYDRQNQYDVASGTSHQWSGEAHLNSTLDGPFNFLIGGNYLNFQSKGDYAVIATGLDYASLLFTGAAKAGLGAPYFDSRTQLYTLNAWALFGEGYWQATETLKLTIGARYTSDSKYVEDAQPNPLFNLGATPLGTQDISNKITYRTPHLDQTAGTGRILLQWTPTLSWTDQTMVYASYSRGYKSGGINPGFNPAVITDAKVNFGAEHVNAFEIGWKNRAFNGTLQANLTGFYYDYQGMQISRIIARSSFNDNTDATVYGLEAEFVIQPSPALQLNANFSYLHTSIKDLAIPDSRDPSGGRSDTVIIKDASLAGAGANCIVQPTVSGNAAGANLLVNTVNATLPGGFKGTTPVPGTQTTGAFSYCSALASAIANPSPALRTLFNAPTGPLPFHYITQGDGSVIVPTGVDVDLSGNQLQNSPEFKFAVGAQYNFDIGANMNGWVRGDLNFTGNAYGRIQNSFADQMPAYTTINLQAQINGANNRWYIRGFVQNLLDNSAITGIYVTDASSGLFSNIFTVDPRRYGAAVGFNF
ncbi:TonB-dependent receptor [Polymorphobacter arshaanensis]|nr:TonB-dependent receptor [Polymorphobacter arshaanensis]